MNTEKIKIQCDSFEEFDDKDAVVSPAPRRNVRSANDPIRLIAMKISQEFSMSLPRAEQLVERVLYHADKQKKESA